MPRVSSRNLLFAAIVVILVASIPAVTLIPFGPYWGIDLQNLFAFHHCPLRDDPYTATGELCGDMAGRDMFYPPLLYWSFIWLRGVPFDIAVALWAAAVVAATAICTWIWVGARERSTIGNARLSVLVALLVVQFPVAFAVERGNNDVVVLVAWTVSLWLFLGHRFAAAGAAAATAVLLKIYPAFGVVVMGGGLIALAVFDRQMIRRALGFVVGGIAATALLVLPLAGQVFEYLTDQLPRFAGELPALSIYGHPLHLLAEASVGWALSLPLLVVWLVSASRLVSRDPRLVFAGGLAISTYFAGTSYDYNLMTAYPLLVVLFARAMGDRPSRTAGALLLLGVVAIIGNRAVFAVTPALMEVHIALQWIWLLATGLLAADLTPRLDRTSEDSGLAGTTRMARRTYDASRVS